MAATSAVTALRGTNHGDNPTQLLKLYEFPQIIATHETVGATSHLTIASRKLQPFGRLAVVLHRAGECIYFEIFFSGDVNLGGRFGTYIVRGTDHIKLSRPARGYFHPSAHVIETILVSVQCLRIGGLHANWL
jgi:hypothetical protein